MTLYRVEPRPGGVRILDENEEQVGMVEVPPGAELRRALEAAGWQIVRAGSAMTIRVLVQRAPRRP